MLVGLLVSSGGSQAGGPSSNGPETGSAIRAPHVWPVPDGVVMLDLPADWERNPRLASDNNARAFLHPTGMEIGQEIPVWIVVKRRLRELRTFERFTRQCLSEGEARDFFAQDSTVIETVDGRRLINYRFNPTAEGCVRALALLETPEGALLFRQQAQDMQTWEDSRGAMDKILGSLRFLTKYE